MGRLNPRRETKTKGRNRDREKEMREEVRNRGNVLARKRRRRGRAERRLLRQRKRRNQGRTRGREITVATHNVRTMAVDGKHGGVGRALYNLSVNDRLGCGDKNGGKKGQGGVFPQTGGCSEGLGAFRFFFKN